MLRLVKTAANIEKTVVSLCRSTSSEFLLPNSSSGLNRFSEYVTLYSYEAKGITFSSVSSVGIVTLQIVRRLGMLSMATGNNDNFWTFTGQ